MVNKAIIIGYLGRDPEIRYMPNGNAVATISVATTRKWKDKTSGENPEETEWHRITAFERLAELLEEYTTKGSLVYVEGRIKTRKYTDKDGVEKYATEIVAENIRFLSRSDEDKPTGARGPAASPSNRPAPQKPRPNKTTGSGFDSMDDDIPF